MEPYQNLIIGIVILLVLIAIVVGSILWLNRLFKGVPIGGQCALDTDCNGYGLASTDVACCRLVCTQKAVDYIGVGYCPGDCKGCPTCKLGTCGNWSSPKKIGEPCGLDTDCEGYGIAVDDNACCNGICEQKIRDYGGGGVCSNVCQSAPGSLPDTCSTSWHWPREVGEPCALDTDCVGWSSSN